MGQATILSEIGDGQYHIRYLRDFARAEAELAAIGDSILKIEEEIAKLEADLVTINNELEPLTQTVKNLIAAEAAQPGIDKDIEKQITAALKALAQKAVEKKEKQIAIDIKNLEKASKEKKKTQIQNAVSAKKTVDMDAWCVDKTTGIANGTLVGTLETDDDTMVFTPAKLIKPAGQIKTDRETNPTFVQPTISSGASAVFYNLALLPGVQKWKPWYRKGTITALAGNSCSVTLDNTVSSRHPRGYNLGINQSLNLTSVPIVYMNCDGAAFQNGDRVIVDFGGNQTTPRVIGFVDHPRACPGGGGVVYRTRSSILIQGGIAGRNFFGLPGLNWSVYSYCQETTPASSPIVDAQQFSGSSFGFVGGWVFDPPSLATTPNMSIGFHPEFFSSFNNSVLRIYQHSSTDTGLQIHQWRVHVPWVLALTSGLGGKEYLTTERQNADGSWTIISESFVGFKSPPVVTGSFDVVCTSEDELTAGVQTSPYYEGVGGSFIFDTGAGTASGSLYLRALPRCDLESSLNLQLYEYRDPPDVSIPYFFVGDFVKIGSLRIHNSAPAHGFNTGDKMRCTVEHTTGTFDATEAAKWQLFTPPTTSTWAANESVSVGDYRKAPSGIGGFMIGEIMVSLQNRTTGSTFNSTEAANWRHDWPEIIVVSSMKIGITNVQIIIGALP